MLKSADLIPPSNACELEAHCLGQFKARATENMFGKVVGNYAMLQENEHSVAFDGIAFDKTDSRGLCSSKLLGTMEFI